MRERGPARYTNQQAGVFLAGIAIGIIVGIATSNIVPWMMTGAVFGAILIALLSLRTR